MRAWPGGTNLSPQILRGADTGGSQVVSRQPGLQSKFKANLGNCPKLGIEEDWGCNLVIKYVWLNKSACGSAGRWWRTPLIPALGKQRQEDLCEFEDSLVYRVSFRTARATQRNPVSSPHPTPQKETN